LLLFGELLFNLLPGKMTLRSSLDPIFSPCIVLFFFWLYP
jgi:hypothetical protein